jgi:hypothetical protein
VTCVDSDNFLNKNMRRVADGTGVKKGDFCVVEMPSVGWDAACPVVGMRPDSMQIVDSVILSGLADNFDAAREANLRLWKPGKELVYHIRGMSFNRDVSHVLTLLARNGAFGEETAVLVAPSETKNIAALNSLKAATLVNLVRSSWYISRLGRSELDYGTHLQTPMLMCEPREGFFSFSIQDLSNFELLLAMERCGFTWEKLPDPKKRPQLSIFEVVAPIEGEGAPAAAHRLIWYGGFYRYYTEILLTAQREPSRFVDKGIVRFEHFRRKGYYRRLMKYVMSDVNVVLPLGDDEFSDPGESFDEPTGLNDVDVDTLEELFAEDTNPAGTSVPENETATKAKKKKRSQQKDLQRIDSLLQMFDSEPESGGGSSNGEESHETERESDRELRDSPDRGCGGQRREPGVEEFLDDGGGTGFF